MRNYPILFIPMMAFVFSCFHNQLIADCVYEKSLEGEVVAIGTLLSWSTVSETESSLFIIEKSSDGKKYEATGTLAGAGHSNVIKKYSFLDIKASAGTLYYRLKQVDFDGSYQYSEVLSLNKTAENNFIVVDMTSETTTKKFDMTVDAVKNTDAVCLLKDARGNVIKEQNVPMTAGLNTVSVDLSDQGEGMYKVVLLAGTESETLVIRRVLDETERASNVATNKKADVRKN